MNERSPSEHLTPTKLSIQILLHKNDTKFVYHNENIVNRGV